MAGDLTNIDTNLELTMFDAENTTKIKNSLELKIDWFKHVLSNLEKLDNRYSKLTNKVHTIETDLRSNIASIKEYIYVELKYLRSEITDCKENSHNSFDQIKINFDTKVDKMGIKIDYEKDRLEDTILVKLNNKLDLLDVKTDKINTIVITLKVKMAMIGVLSGVVGSIILIAAQFIFKKYF